MCPVKVKESLLDHVSVCRILSCGNTVYSKIILVFTCKMHGLLSHTIMSCECFKYKTACLYGPPRAGDKWSISAVALSSTEAIGLYFSQPFWHSAVAFYSTKSVSCTESCGALPRFGTHCHNRLAIRAKRCVAMRKRERKGVRGLQ